jgi:hypothetical protein
MSEQTGNTPRIERFGPYRFDLDRSTLYRGTEPVILARKRLEVLQLLAEHASSIVRREEIIKRVWPDQLIEENNLAIQIFQWTVPRLHCKARGYDDRDPPALPARGGDGDGAVRNQLLLER